MPRLDHSLTSRRQLLVGLSGGAAAATAGCLGGSQEDESVAPIALDGERACDQCGMIVGDHPGPVGQIHFADDEPEGGRPGQFCSSICTYTYRFDAEDEERTILETFLTDYSQVDEEVYQEGSDMRISSHVAADAQSQTSTLTVVADSEVVGAMGPALVPFGDESDATAFVDDYGGESMAAESVDSATLEAL